MSKAHTHELHRPAAAVAPTFGGVVVQILRLPMSVLDTLLLWQERAGQRFRLAQMDDRLLADMGLSRADVEHETSIPFWRAS